jgi:hypothetical protein
MVLRPCRDASRRPFCTHYSSARSFGLIAYDALAKTSDPRKSNDLGLV